MWGNFTVFSLNSWLHGKEILINDFYFDNCWKITYFPVHLMNLSLRKCFEHFFQLMSSEYPNFIQAGVYFIIEDISSCFTWTLLICFLQRYFGNLMSFICHKLHINFPKYFHPTLNFNLCFFLNVLFLILWFLQQSYFSPFLFFFLLIKNFNYANWSNFSVFLCIFFFWLVSTQIKF